MSEPTTPKTMELEFRWGADRCFVLRFPGPGEVMSPEAAAHLRQAGRHTLLSLRAMMDSVIERCEEPAAEKTRIKVE